MGPSTKYPDNSKSRAARKNISDESSDSDSISDPSSDSDDSSTENSDVENRNTENNDDEDDEVVRAIRLEKEKKSDHPPDIEIEDSITDISFHPVNDLIALSTDVGDVLLFKYSNERNELVNTFELHTRTTRAVEFNEDGNLLFSAGKDKSVMVTDMETGKLKTFYEKMHPHHIYSLKVISNTRFVTGDDNGDVRMWDLRADKKPIFVLNIGTEYVSDLVSDKSTNYLACAGGDGTLTSINMRTRKIFQQSEEHPADLTCLGLFRTGTKLLVGSSKGKVYLYNWPEVDVHNDEYTGHKRGISCLAPITENIVVTSGEDGILRATHIYPHRQLGVVGQHDLPVEKMDINNDGHLIASCTLNETVKFWNVSYFEYIEEVVDTEIQKNKRRDMKNNLPSSRYRNASDFFSGMA